MCAAFAACCFSAFILYFLPVLWYNGTKCKWGREMKKLISWVAICLITVPAMAVTSAGQSRRSMTSQMVMSAPRATASTNQISDMANAGAGAAVVDKSSVRVPATDYSGVSGSGDSGNTGDDNQGGTGGDDNDDVLAEIERQKQACLNNNIGVGNTFVWASRYSNTSNYATMVEDVNNPENNVCFVLVGVTSSDARIDVSDVPTRYYHVIIKWGKLLPVAVGPMQMFCGNVFWTPNVRGAPGRLLVVLLVVSALGLVPWNCLEIV